MSHSAIFQLYSEETIPPVSKFWPAARQTLFATEDFSWAMSILNKVQWPNYGLPAAGIEPVFVAANYLLIASSKHYQLHHNRLPASFKYFTCPIIIGEELNLHFPLEKIWSAPGCMTFHGYQHPSRCFH